MIRAPHEEGWPIWRQFVATVPDPERGKYVRDILLVGEREELSGVVFSFDLVRHCQDSLISAGAASWDVLERMEVWVVTRPLWPRESEWRRSFEECLRSWSEGSVGFDEPWGLRIFPAQVLDSWVTQEVDPPSDSPCWMHYLNLVKAPEVWLEERLVVEERIRRDTRRHSGLLLMVAGPEFAPGIVPVGYVVTTSYAPESTWREASGPSDPYLGRVLSMLPPVTTKGWVNCGLPSGLSLLPRHKVSEPFDERATAYTVYKGLSDLYYRSDRLGRSADWAEYRGYLGLQRFPGQVSVIPKR